MKKSVDLYLRDIIEMINRVERSTEDLTREEFYDDLDSQDMTIRRIEIIGEAIKQMPQDFKDEHPKVPWKKITATRNILIHGYTEISIKRIWDIVQKDLQPLKKHILKFLEELEN